MYLTLAPLGALSAQIPTDAAESVSMPERDLQHHQEKERSSSISKWRPTTCWGARVSSPLFPGCYVDKFAPHKALKVTVRCKLTFDGKGRTPPRG